MYNLAKKLKQYVDLIWLIGSSVCIKLIGIVREALIAAFIGSSSLELSFYIVLRAGVEVLHSLITGVPILEGIFVPLYSNVYNQDKTISFRSILNTVVKSLPFLSLACTLLIIVFMRKMDSTLTMFHWIIAGMMLIYYLLSVIGNVGYVILKVKGQFDLYSRYSSYSSIFGVIALALILFYTNLEVYGIVLSVIFVALLGIIYTWRNVKVSDSGSSIEKVSIRHFNVPRMIAIGHVVFLGFSTKLIIGMDSTVAVNYFHFAFTIVFSLIIVFGFSLSTMILYNSAVAGLVKDYNKYFGGIVFATIGCCFIVYFFSQEIVNLLYYRGNFSRESVFATVRSLQFLSFPMGFLVLSHTLMQSLLISDQVKSGVTLKRLGCVVFFMFFVALILSMLTSKYIAIGYGYILVSSGVCFLLILNGTYRLFKLNKKLR